MAKPVGDAPTLAPARVSCSRCRSLFPLASSSARSASSPSCLAALAGTASRARCASAADHCRRRRFQCAARRHPGTAPALAGGARTGRPRLPVAVAGAARDDSRAGETGVRYATHTRGCTRTCIRHDRGGRRRAAANGTREDHLSTLRRAESVAGPGGLAVLAFREGTPYRGEDLIYEDLIYEDLIYEDLIYNAAAPERFLVRCSRNGAGPTPGSCLYSRRIGGADIVVRFPRDWLGDWKLISDGIERLITSLRRPPASVGLGPSIITSMPSESRIHLSQPCRWCGRCSLSHPLQYLDKAPNGRRHVGLLPVDHSYGSPPVKLLDWENVERSRPQSSGYHCSRDIHKEIRICRNLQP